jgi:GNAT superfamily N-acetyltransferase
MVMKGQAAMQTHACTIRPARVADLDALIALYREFHAFHVYALPAWLRLPPDDDALEVRTTLTKLLGDEDAMILVSEADNAALVGLAEAHLRRDELHPATVAYTFGYLQSLFVTAAWRGRGVGKQLVAAAQCWAGEHGAAQMRLSCWEFAAGPIPFYEALGYTTLKRTLVVALAEP